MVEKEPTLETMLRNSGDHEDPRDPWRNRFTKSEETGKHTRSINQIEAWQEGAMFGNVQSKERGRIIRGAFDSSLFVKKDENCLPLRQTVGLDRPPPGEAE